MHKGIGSTQGKSSRTRFVRAARVVIGASVLALFAACSSEPLTAPAAGTSSKTSLSDLLGAVPSLGTKVTGLLRIKLVGTPISRSQTFDRTGGQLSIPELGFSLKVPADAIPGTTLTITVTAIPGKLVAYDFEPHGTQFRKPLTFTQALGGTNWLTSLLRPQLSGGYFRDGSQLNQTNGTALINESFRVLIDNNAASFDITHFSGYMVSSGRSSESPDSSME